MSNPWRLVKTISISLRNIVGEREKMRTLFLVLVSDKIFHGQVWREIGRSSFSKWPIPTVSGRQMKLVGSPSASSAQFGVSRGIFSKREREGIGWPFFLSNKGLSPLLRFLKRDEQIVWTSAHKGVQYETHTHTFFLLFFPSCVLNKKWKKK